MEGKEEVKGTDTHVDMLENNETEIITHWSRLSRIPPRRGPHPS